MEERNRAQDRIRIKRAYEEPTPDDGYRVLVDRMWPRGVTKEKLRLDAWLKELAPSTELRKWFGHHPARWEEFERRYEAELSSPKAQTLLTELAERATLGLITLLYAAKDERHNNAVVLRRLLAKRLGPVAA